MSFLRFHLALLLATLAGCSPPSRVLSDTPVSRIAFGSCASQEKPQPIWETVLAHDPEVWIWMGDNVYADTDDPGRMAAAYARLAAVPGYQRLAERARILATWDDHDYGQNDGGAAWHFKEEAQRLFMDFFGEPPASERRNTPGVYDAVLLGPPGFRIQVLLLDTRTFRSPPERIARKDRKPGNGPYLPSLDPDATLLGDTQWAWLEEQLQEPAEVRILVSSIQLLTSGHGWECWSNFPLEQERLFNLVKQHDVGGLVTISGDRHHGEISRLAGRVGYPLFEITSSGLNQGRPPTPEQNPLRIGELVLDRNFGLLTIDWEQQDPTLVFEIRDIENRVRAQYEVHLSDLDPTGS